MVKILSIAKYLLPITYYLDRLDQISIGGQALLFWTIKTLELYYYYLVITMIDVIQYYYLIVEDGSTDRVRLPILLVVSSTGEIFFFPVRVRA